MLQRISKQARGIANASRRLKPLDRLINLSGSNLDGDAIAEEDDFAVGDFPAVGED